MPNQGGHSYYLGKEIRETIAWYNIMPSWNLSFKVISVQNMNIHIFKRNGTELNPLNARTSTPFVYPTSASSSRGNEDQSFEEQDEDDLQTYYKGDSSSIDSKVRDLSS